MQEVGNVQSQLNKNNTDLARSAKLADKALSDLGKQDFKKSARGAQGLTDEIKDAEKAALDLDARLKALDDDFGRVSNQVGQAGDIESSINAIGGAASGFGGGAVGGALGGGAELFAVIEAAPRLTTAFKGLPDILQKSAQSTAFVSQVTSGLTPVLGATGAAVAGFATILLPIAATVAAVTFAFKELDKINKDAAESARRAADARQIQRDVEREFAELSDVEQLQERNRLFEESAERGADLNEELAVLAELQRQLDEETGVFGGRLNGVRAAFNEQKEVVDELIVSSANANAALAEAEEQIADIGEAERARALNAENLEIIEQQLADVESERAQIATQLEASQSKLNSLEERRLNLIESRADAEANAAELAALESEFAQEDQLAQEQEFRDELASIAEAGREKIAGIEDEIKNLRIDQVSAIADIEAQGRAKIDKIQSDGNAKLADINADYIEKSIQDAEDFATESRRIAQDRETTLRRLAEDGLAALRDAERGNDVLSFLQAQDENAKQLRRTREDLDTDEKRRAEDRATQLERDAEAQRQRIADIQAQIQEQTNQQLAAIEAEKQKATEAFNERQAQLEASKESELQAIEETKQAAIDMYNEQEAREQQQADRQAQRDAIREAQEEERFQQQLADIEQLKQAELARLQAIQNELNNLSSQQQDLQSQQNQLTSGSSSKFNLNPPGGASSPFSITPFADGGFVDRPTLALIGEAGPEMVIPMRPNNSRLPGGMGQPVIVNLSMNNTVGDVATKSMLEREGMEIFTALADGLIVPMIEKALAGKAS